MTPRMWDALRAVDARITAHGFAPSLTEISADLGLKSRSQIHGLINRLIQRGFLLHPFRNSCARNLAVTEAGRAALEACSKPS